MSYLDTTLTADTGAGYAAVNVKQEYDAMATQLAARGWVFVESVDYVHAPTTTRSYVWQCPATLSGLPADFYVTFVLDFVSTGTIWATAGVSMFLHEGYSVSTHMISKPAAFSPGSVTIAADRSNPATWVLTAARPAPTMTPCQVTSPGAGASERLLIGVTADTLFISGDRGGQHAHCYLGAYDTLMSVSDDPMPLVILSSSTPANYVAGFCTRHPKLTPSTAYTNAFGAQPYLAHTTISSAYQWGAAAWYPSPASQAGTLGDPTDTKCGMFTNGVPVGRVPLSSAGSAETGATRGGLRGFLKHVLSAATLAAHSAGDTFVIDGAAWVGMGAQQYGLWDTTA